MQHLLSVNDMNENFIFPLLGKSLQPHEIYRYRNDKLAKLTGLNDVIISHMQKPTVEKVTFKRQNTFIKKSIQNTNKSIKEILLTNRERQILKLITQEANNTDIALSLNISKRTVETHKKNIFLKLGATNTIGLIKIALKSKLLKI